MSNPKFSKRRSSAVKPLVLVLSVILVISCVVGGTLAWLTAQTDAVVNTFTTSGIDITLVEKEGGENHEFKMIPGHTIAKDPKVTVEAGSEDCFLFVKLEESSNFKSFMTYEVADSWTQVPNVDGVYYREVTAINVDQAFDVLKDNQVSVSDTVTKEDMSNLTSNTYPTLTVTAYATQLWKSNTEKFDVNNAWIAAQPANP